MLLEGGMKGTWIGMSRVERGTGKGQVWDGHGPSSCLIPSSQGLNRASILLYFPLAFRILGKIPGPQRNEAMQCLMLRNDARVPLGGKERRLVGTPPLPSGLNLRRGRQWESQG